MATVPKRFLAIIWPIFNEIQEAIMSDPVYVTFSLLILQQQIVSENN
jgi:hypothetical protein